MADRSEDWSWEFTPQVEQQPAAPATPGNVSQPVPGQHIPPAGAPTFPAAPAAPHGSGDTTAAPSQFAHFAPAVNMPNSGAYTNMGAHQMESYQPGVMPFRPLRFGEFFDCAFRSMRFNPQPLFAYSSILVAFGIVTFFIMQLLLGGMIEQLSSANPFSTLAGFMGVVGLQGLISTLITGFLVFIVIGAIQGKKVTFTEVWEATKGTLVRLSLLIIIAGVVSSVVSFSLTFATGFILESASTDKGAAAGIVAFVAMASSFIIIGGVAAWCAITIPVLVVERIGVFASLRRSAQLLKGSFFRTVSLLALAYMVVSTITGILSMILLPLFGYLLYMVGTFTTDSGVASGVLALMWIGGSVLQFITMPFMAAFITLVYTDIRMRKEGLDIALIEASVTEQ